MKKCYSIILPVVKGFLYCAVAVQIVLGILYIGSNFMTVPQFQETAIYLEMTENFVADEYIGVLYPLLVWLCTAIPWIPYQIPIYLIQIVVGIFCVYHFACAWTEKKRVAFICALWINTIPFIAQAHVTVLPHSLAFSFLILMFLEVLKAVKNKTALSTVDWSVLLCSYTILVQLAREYFMAGMLLVVWAVCMQIYAPKRKALLFFATVMISLGIVSSNVAIYKITETEGYYGRIQRSPEAAFFQRVGMSTMTDRFMIYMPEEIGECFTGEELEEFARFPYKVQTEFGPTLEARYGKEYANELYWKLGWLGLGNATTDSLKNIAEDACNYVIPAAMYYTWRNGELKGMTGWNYQQFVEQAPGLSVTYVRVSQFLWLLGFGTSLAACVVLAFHRGKLYTRLWLPVLIYLGLNGLYFALGGVSAYDYKLALLPLALNYAWIACMLNLAGRELYEQTKEELA